MSAQLCLSRLRRGPATSRELADVCSESSGAVARIMAGLIKQGLAKRVDTARGRGSVALYGLAETARPQAETTEQRVDLGENLRRSALAAQCAELRERYVALSLRVQAERRAA